MIHTFRFLAKSTSVMALALFMTGTIAAQSVSKQAESKQAAGKKVAEKVAEKLTDPASKSNDAKRAAAAATEDRDREARIRDIMERHEAEMAAERRLEDPPVLSESTPSTPKSAPQRPTYRSTNQVDSYMGGHTTKVAPVPHTPTFHNVSHRCPRCVDRTGESAGMIGGFGITHGIGPCGDKECQCWACPYESPFDINGPGEYAGPARTQRLPEYRLRTGDSVQFTYLMTPMKSSGAYRLAVGDELLIESVADEDLTRGTLEKGLQIQPDGTITLRLIGQVHAAGQTVEQLRDLLEESYKEYYPKPSIDVTPVNTGTAARQVREAISGVGGFDPQSVTQTITPAGEIRLPRLGSVQAQGLSLDELKQEINLRYDSVVGGLEIEPSLLTQAPHYCFVLGEVAQPGRYNIDTPTTVLGAVALAGGRTLGANLRQVVIFRRGDNWELISTLVDLRGAMLGRTSNPHDEVWIRDGDVVILPEAPIELFNNFVQQVFTEGIYGIIPLSVSYNFGDSFN